MSENVGSITKRFTKIGIDKTRGSLVNKVIDNYKISKNLFVLNLIPNRIYCLAGYWIEYLRPGTFESILFEKSKKTINEFKGIKLEIDDLMFDIKSEYKKIEKDMNFLF